LFFGLLQTKIDSSMKEKKLLKKKSQNLSDWYTDVILKAELADYAPIKGCMVIRPYGYALWEGIREFMDSRIKKRGVKNAYFPIFIPESYLNKEKEHVAGFSPQVAVVTFAGGEELKEKLVVRPTSETIMYEMYKKWSQSYRDLPIMINQWNNIVRWEKRTYLFLRTSEFLWQEGHCAHLRHEESAKTVNWALEMYQETYRELLAVWGVAGLKSEAEKFAGGDQTYTYEILMPDGKALQGCTSHDLGQNFAKAFDWTVLDDRGKQVHPWQNSWGFSTRSIGGLIMVHGDDNGLIMPPRVAPIQAVAVPIKPGKIISDYVAKVVGRIGGSVRIEVDERQDETVGFKFNKWEVKGVPVRLEIGEKEVAESVVTVVRRDSGEKLKLRLGDLKAGLGKMLEDIQFDLLERQRRFTMENTHSVGVYDEFRNIMATRRGFIRAFWCGNPECEVKIKEETKATVRCLPLDAKNEAGKCIYCGGRSDHRWLFAQSY